MTSNLSAGAASSWSKLPAPPRSNGHPFYYQCAEQRGSRLQFFGKETYLQHSFHRSSGVYYYNNTSSTWYDRSDPNMRFLDPGCNYQIPTTPVGNTWYGRCFRGDGDIGGYRDRAVYSGPPTRARAGPESTDNIRVNSHCTINPETPTNCILPRRPTGLWYSAMPARGARPIHTGRHIYPFRHPYEGILQSQ